MKQGFLQALGVAAYIFLIGFFIWNAEKLFPKLDVPWGPILFLLLFSTSAMICGLLVFYKPYKLFLAGKGKEGVKIVVATACWLLTFLLAFLLTLLLIRG